MDDSLLKIGIIVILIYIICYLNDNNQTSQSVEQQIVQKQEQSQQQRQQQQRQQQQRQQQVVENFAGNLTPPPQRQPQKQPQVQQPQVQQPVIRAHVQSGNSNATVQQQQQQQQKENGLIGKSRETSGNAGPQGIESGPQQQQASFQSSEKQKVDASGNVINTCGNDILTSAELLPSDVKTTWSEVTPVNPGGLESKNFLDSGFHIGINTVGQSMRNANRQLRSDPAIPKVEVSIWNRSTIDADDNRRPLEIGGACEN